jgi:hypothetical protein
MTKRPIEVDRASARDLTTLALVAHSSIDRRASIELLLVHRGNLVNFCIWQDRINFP